MKYFVTVGERTVEVDLDGERVLVNGREHRVELRSVVGTPVRNLLVDGRSFVVPVESVAPGRWVLQCGGDRFEVEVVDERTRYIRSLVGEGRVPAGPSALRAPMPGLVVRILVEPGQLVSVGQGIVVLEAMKMENELKAPAPGVVETVHVLERSAVEKGQTLVSFGSPV